MSIVELTTVVSPPVSPVGVVDRDAWDRAQAYIKTLLPDDLHDIGLAFGSGAFRDIGRLDIWIFNPFAPTYVEAVDTRRYNLEAMKIGEGDEYVPYEVFPSPGGLLALGDDVNGNELYWLTQGEPNNWPIVVRDECGAFQQFDGPLSRFLALAFTRRISVSAWPEPFFAPGNVVFMPDEASA